MLIKEQIRIAKLLQSPSNADQPHPAHFTYHSRPASSPSPNHLINTSTPSMSTPISAAHALEHHEMYPMHTPQPQTKCHMPLATHRPQATPFGTSLTFSPSNNSLHPPSNRVTRRPPRQTHQCRMRNKTPQFYRTCSPAIQRTFTEHKKSPRPGIQSRTARTFAPLSILLLPFTFNAKRTARLGFATVQSLIT